MGLEEIEGIRADIKKLKDEREINIREAKESISNIKTRYNSLLEKEGEKYCTENCSDIPAQINKLAQEFSAFYNQ